MIPPFQSHNHNLIPCSDLIIFPDSDNNQSLFDGEELAGFTNDRYHNDNLSTPSSPSESPFPWKTATNSSSVLLRHFAARSSKQDENSLRGMK